MRILHISADFPDPLVPAKTRAVSNLLDLIGEHEHLVYSLNRTGWRTGIKAEDFGEGARAVAYGAPPKGLMLARYLDRLADWIAGDLARRGVSPDIIHAHKLSIEGLVADTLSRRLGVPVMVSIQGNSDAKIIGSKVICFQPGLRGRYARIWRDAVHVFPFAPWAGKRMAELLGPRTGPVTHLPCPGPAERIIPPQVVGPLFRSAFNLGFYKLKNAEALIRATSKAAQSVPDLRMEIIGGGDDAAHATLSALAKGEGGHVRLVGAVQNDQIQPTFNAACAFALVSHRESFGMVFAEALLAGCPVLSPRGRAIDGYFEEGSIGLAADPNDEEEIADNLTRLAREEADFKARLAGMQDSGGLAFLQRAAIAQSYRDALTAASGG